MRIKRNALSILFVLANLRLFGQMWVEATPFPAPDGIVNCMIEYNGEMYIGGEFMQAGGLVANHLAKWNGTAWSAVGIGNELNNQTTIIHEFHEFNNELYIATSDGLFKWNNISFSEVPIPILTSFGSYNHQTMETFQGKLLVGRNTSWAGDCNMIIFDGVSWSCFSEQSPGGPSTSSDTRDFIIFNNELYACGGFGIYKWDGIGSWIDVGGISIETPQLSEMAVFNNEIYVVDDLSTMTIGGISTNGIAKYNGTNWSLPGNVLTETVSSFGHVNNLDGVLYSRTNKVDGSTLHSIMSWNGMSWSLIALNSLQPKCTLMYGGALYAGNSSLNQPLTSPNALYLAKLDPNAVELSEVDDFGFRMYPNPANSSVTLESDLNVETIEILDYTGRVVFWKKVGSKLLLLNFPPELTMGMYLCRVKFSNQKTSQTKFLKN